MWRFSGAFQLNAVDDCVIAVSESSERVFVGAEFVAILGLLDGNRTLDEVVTSMAGVFSRSEAVDALRRLRRAGVIVRHRAPTSAAERFLESVGDGSVLPDLAGVTVAAVPLAEERLAVRVADTLAEFGCRVLISGPEAPITADISVVIVDDYLCPGLHSFNETARAAAHPWMPVKPQGLEAWIGPCLAPGSPGCWKCLAERLAANRQASGFLARNAPGSEAASGSAAGLLPGIEGMVAAIVGMEVAKRQSGRASDLTGTLRTIDLKDFRIEDHDLICLPQCAESGSTRRIRGTASEIPGSIRDSPSPGSAWGRAWSADAVIDRFGRHVDRHLGAVSRLTPIPAHDPDAGHTVTAKHAFPGIGRDVGLLRQHLLGASSGRGLTEVQARAGALCEALERYSGVWIEGTPEVRSSWAALDRRAVHPNEMTLYSESQYEGRETWNAQPENRLQYVAEPFDLGRPIAFTEGWSLTRAEPVLVPAAVTWYGHPDLRDHRYTATDSNGCAAGGSVGEAVFHGLREVYERDAVAIWWYNRVPRPGVSLRALGDPSITAAVDYCARNQRKVWILDISTDLSMPAYAAVSRRDHVVEDVLFGFGAHPDPREAVRQAVAEMMQLLPMVMRRAADGSPRYTTDDPAGRGWFDDATCAREQWLVPHGEVPLPALPGRFDTSSAGIEETIAHYVADLRSSGIETIVVDQTRPDIGMPVVKVLCPGMRHFWRRTAPGRLFDVPVALGWQPTPTPESALNHFNVFV